MKKYHLLLAVGAASLLSAMAVSTDLSGKFSHLLKGSGNHREFALPDSFSATASCPANWTYASPKKDLKWISQIQGGDPKLKTYYAVTSVDINSYTSKLSFKYDGDPEISALLAAQSVTFEAYFGLHNNMFSTKIRDGALEEHDVTYVPAVGDRLALTLGQKIEYQKNITVKSIADAPQTHDVPFAFEYSGCGMVSVGGRTYPVAVIDVWDVAIVKGKQRPVEHTYYVSGELGIALAQSSPSGPTIVVRVT